MMNAQQRMLDEKEKLAADLKTLQAVFDSEEYKTFHSGAQRRILKQLEAMYLHYDILRSRIAEEEFY